MAPASKLGRGKPLKNQTKEVLHKIYRYFESEIERDPNSSVTAAQLVTHSTGISMNALKRVLSEQKTTVVKKETKSKRRCKRNLTSDDFDAQAIRRIIHNFYNKDEEFPIMKDLYLILKADIDYQGSLCTLRRHVAKLGFKWVNKEDNNSILLEKHDYRYTRVQYLSKIEEYRSEGRNIVYTGDSIIESSRISSKPKPDGRSTVLKQPAKSKLTILLAGNQGELIKNSLYMFDNLKKEVKDEDRKESHDQYEKWFKYQLMPNLKPGSVVVVDSSSAFHNRVSNPTPHSNSRKKEMMDYLSYQNVPYSADMYKPQLYQLVLMNKDKHTEYRTDILLRENGHLVLRLPALHPDLNPIKNLLSVVKDYIGRDVCLNIDSMMKIGKEKVMSFTDDDWSNACRTAEAEENHLKAIDKIIDDISERYADTDSEGSYDDDEGSDDSGDSE